MTFINKSDKEFSDISSELFRQYTFPGGEVIRIANPQQLNVSDNGHRVFSADGTSHYIPLGWIHLEWQVAEGQPNFVR